MGYCKDSNYWKIFDVKCLLSFINLHLMVPAGLASDIPCIIVS